MEFEHETPRALMKRAPGDTMFFGRIVTRSLRLRTSMTLSSLIVRRFGYLTLLSFERCDSCLITVHPQMLDVLSMAQFLTMTGDLLEVVAAAGGTTKYDWMNYPLQIEPRTVPKKSRWSHF